MGAQLSSADSHFVDLLLDFESPIPLPKHATINAGLLHAQRPNGSATGVGSGGGVMSGGIGTLLGLGGLFGSRGGGGGAAAVSSHQAAAAASESSCIPLYYQCDGPIPPHISKRIMGRTSHMYVSQNKNKEAREKDKRKVVAESTSEADARVEERERAQIENNQHMATTKNEKVKRDASSTSSLSSVFVKAQKLRAERIRDLLHFTSVLLDQCTCNGSVSSSAPVPAALALTRVVVKSIIEETAARVQKIRTRNPRKESQRLLRRRKRGGAEESNLNGSSTVVGQQQKAAEIEVFMAGDNAVVSGGSAENDIMMPKGKEAPRPQLTTIRLGLQEAFWLRDQYLLKDAPRRFQEKRNQKDCYQQHQRTLSFSAAAVELASPVVPKLIANICDFIIRCPITPSTALTHVESLKLLLLFCSCGLYDSFEGASAVLKHTLAATTTSSATAAFSVAEADAANSTGAADDEKKKKKQRDLNSVTASGLTVSDEEDDDGLAAALKRHRRLLRVPNRNEDINSKKTSKRRRHHGGVAPRSDRELTLSSTSGSDQEDDDFNENRNNRGYFSSSSPQSSSSSSAAAFYSDDEDPTEKSYNFKKNTTTTRGSLSASRTSPSLSAADLFVDILLGSETAAGLVLELIRRAALFKVIVSNGGVSNANTSAAVNVGISGLTSSVQTAMSVGVGGGLDLALLGLQPLSSDDDAVRTKVCHQLAASLPQATTVTTNITSRSRGVFSSSVGDKSAASPSHDATTSEDQKQSQSSKVPLLALVASSYNMYGSTVAAMAVAPRGCGGGGGEGENGHLNTNPLAVYEDQSGHGNQGAVAAAAPDIHSSVSASKEDSIGREVDRHSSTDGGAVARHSILGAVPQHALPRRTSNDSLNANPNQSMPCEDSTEDGGGGVGWFGGWFRGGGGGLSNSNKKHAGEMRKDEFVSPLPKGTPKRDVHPPPQQVLSSDPVNDGDNGVVSKADSTNSRRKEDDEGIKGNGLLQPKDEERDAGNDENGMLQDTSSSSSSSSSGSNSSSSDVSSDEEEEEDCVLHQYASASGNNGAAVPSSAPFGSVKAYSARSVLYELSLQLLCVLLFHRRGFEASSSVSENNTDTGNWFAAGSDGDDRRDNRGRRSPLSASAAVTPNAAAASAATDAAQVAHTDYLNNRENNFFSNTARDIVKSLVNTKAPTTSSSSAPSTTSAALPSVNYGAEDPNADPSGIHYLQLMHSANPLAISFAQLAASLSAASSEHPLALAVLYSLLVDNKNFLKIMLTKYSDISETMVIAILQSLVASSDCVAERPVVAPVESEDTLLNGSGNTNGEEHQQVKQMDKGSSSGKEVAAGGWLSWLGGGAGSRGQQQKSDTSKNSGTARSSSVTPSVTNSEERHIIVRNDRDAHAQQALLIPAATASNMPRYAYHDHRHHNNNNNNQKRIVALLGSAAGGAGDGSTAVESYNSATAQSLCYAFHLASTLVMVLSQDMCVANALFGPWKLAGQKINSTTSSRKAWSWLTHGTISSCGTLWISAICRCLLRGFTLHYYEATSLLIAALQNVGPFMHNLDTVAAQRLTRVLSGSIRRLPREASEVYRLERLVVMMRRRRAARRQQMLDLLVGSSNSNGTPKNFGDDGNKFSSTDEGNAVWAAAVRLLRLRREERRVASAYLDRRILLKTLVGTIIGLSDCVGGAISVTDKQNYSLFYELLYHKPQLELEGEAAGVPPVAEEDTNNNTAANIQSAAAKRRQIAAAGIAYLKRFRPHLLLLSAAAEEHEGFSSSSLSSASSRRRSRKGKMNACTSQALALLHNDVQNYSSDILLLEGADLDAAVPAPPPLSSSLQNSTADYALSPTTAVGGADPQQRTPMNVSHHQHGGGTVRGGGKSSSPAELLDSGFVYIPSVHSPMTAACAGAANDSAFVLVAEALKPVRSIAAMVDTELASVSVNHTPEGILALIRSVVASHAALLEKQRQHQQELHQQSHGSHPHRNMSSSNTTTPTNTGSFNKSPTYVGVGDTQSQISSTAGSSALTTMASNCLDLVFVYRESPASAEFFMPMVWATIVSSGRVGSGHWHADPASLPLLEKAKTIIVSRGANLTNV